jgi:uncharacterized protein YndB with AHSA1/START domain
MKTEELVAEASTTVDAPVAKVWEALVTPEVIKRYMFGATVTSSFEVGSPIRWKGEWKGRPYEDKGKILKVEREHVLSYSHFSPLSGERDVPENYHTVTIELVEQAGTTRVSLKQDKNKDEQARKHAQQNWAAMLQGLKKELE